MAEIPIVPSANPPPGGARTRAQIVRTLKDRGLKVGSREQHVEESYRRWGLARDVKEEVLALAATEEMLDCVTAKTLQRVARAVMATPPPAASKGPVFQKALLAWIADPERRLAAGVALVARPVDFVRPADPPLPTAFAPTATVAVDQAPSRFVPSRIANAPTSETSTRRLGELEAHHAKQGSRGAHYYNYALFDRTILFPDGDAPAPPSLEAFLKAIFYVGKGAGRRLYDYYERALNPRDAEFNSPKLRRARSLWRRHSAYVVLRFSSGVSEAKALDQEAAMIYGLTTLAGRGLASAPDFRDDDPDFLCNTSPGTPRYPGRHRTGTEKGDELARLWDEADEAAYARHVLVDLAYDAFVPKDAKPGEAPWTKAAWLRRELRQTLLDLDPAPKTVEQLREELAQHRARSAEKEEALIAQIQALSLNEPRPPVEGGVFFYPPQ